MSNTSVSRKSKGLEQLRESIRKESGLGNKDLHPRDFYFLEKSIADKLTDVCVGEKTLKRLFGYDKTNEDSCIRLYTLDVLSRYVGFSCWGDFLGHLQDQESKTSGDFLGKTLSADNLNIDARLQIEWAPGRRSVLKYCGSRKFEVVETVNSKWQVGDSFFCKTFIMHRPLYVDRLTSADGQIKSEMYSVGERGGLSALEIL